MNRNWSDGIWMPRSLVLGGDCRKHASEVEEERDYERKP
jgi:hypothetical protein